MRFFITWVITVIAGIALAIGVGLGVGLFWPTLGWVAMWSLSLIWSLMAWSYAKAHGFPSPRLNPRTGNAEALLDKCDFRAAADDVRAFFQMLDKDAAAAGKVAAVRNDILLAAKAFIDSPCRETAVALLNTEPSMWQVVMSHQLSYERAAGRQR